MLVVKTPFVQLIIMLVFVHANLEQLETLFLAAFKFNIVALTTNVQPELSATMEFVTPSAQVPEIASPIKCVFKVFVSQPAKATQPVLTSNTVKITFVFKSQNVSTMKIVRLENIVRSIQMDDQNAKKSVVEGSCAAETQIVSPEIITLNVNAKQDSTLTEKFAERLNAKQTANVAMTNVAKIICAKLYV